MPRVGNAIDLVPSILDRLIDENPEVPQALRMQQGQISASVGEGGVNRLDDVRLVQMLLHQRGEIRLVVDGRCSPQTVTAIRTFQKGFLQNPDGCVDPGSTTWQRLWATSPYDLRQLKKSVARDLEALLNTRQEILAELPADYVEVNRSLLIYGLPDFTSFNLLSPRDRLRLRRALEQAIALFEPRLEQVQVILDPPRDLDRALRFHVEALLRVYPVLEQVTFDAVLQLHTQEYQVQGYD